MPLDRKATIARLKQFDFPGVFTQELGWDFVRRAETIARGAQSWLLTAVAEKRGVFAFHCPPGADGRIPDNATRAFIERELTKRAAEHLLIFTDADRSEQLWLYTRRQPGQPTRLIPYRFQKDRANELLLQKLESITFTLDEEEGLTLTGVTTRLRDALDRDRLTRRFYDRFATEHQGFLAFLKGIPDDGLQRWYVSVLLNRLMFLYFLQEKGFLGGQQRYLQSALARATAAGQNYYRDFLCPLFFRGLACRPAERTPAERTLLGEVPYLNGGLFLRHQIEELHGQTIAIENTAFQKLFAFFDEWQWHLDERPIADGKEINPDVLGYIFEKYINQKQMGAYYTREDITGYIGRNTLLPFLLDAARQHDRAAFDGPGSVWWLLQNTPDRYLYAAVRHGAGLDYPPEIAVGLDTTRPDLIERRKDWNRPAPASHALPTEIWRETIARHQRCAELRRKLAAGEVREVSELVTLNLDIRQFVQDLIEQAESPDLVRAFWKALSTVTILDPTCGSGAFLFAALNLLEPLYEACLDRMDGFLRDEAARLEPAQRRTTSLGVPVLPHRKFGDFTGILDRVAGHPNRRHFIYKTAIVANLFGVDLMEEATEICKLRLFLKLVAQLDSADQIEPLPDIDFNIRAGNTLVGYATRDEVRRALTQFGDGQMRLGVDGELNAFADFSERCAELDRLFTRFREQQTELGGEVTADDKARLRGRLQALAGQLDRYLATDYGVRLERAGEFDRWRRSHQPFHWFLEFYGILHGGGFDVIIGNPPYVELTKVASTYRPKGFSTDVCGNLYALCTEQSFRIARSRGRFGFIVQQPITSTLRMAECRTLIRQNASGVWSATFDDRPSKLFDGMHHARMAILLAEVARAGEPAAAILTTGYTKWFREEREVLFQRLAFLEFEPVQLDGLFAKVSSRIELPLIAKIRAQGTRIENLLAEGSSEHQLFYKITGVGSWFTITHRPPTFHRGGKPSASTREATMSFPTARARDAAFCLLNSSLFFWFYQVRTNCRDFNPSDYRTFPIPDSIASAEMTSLAEELAARLDESSQTVTATHRLTGLISYEQFRPREAKNIIDEIDRVLAQHYGFTEEELDFILNYDIKYRLGLTAEEEAE